MKEVRGNHKSL